ncbi:MAG TPA: DUF2179 domain-containing protein [Fodinibius sp.]|nr:DUF2179 domain-containing protein [Fodinibius sp.]
MIAIINGLAIPLLIFIARIFDVSFGTLRILFVSRGMKARAALLGFVEVLIWVIVIAQLMQHLDNWINYVAYAGGFAAGTYLGITLENKLKVGTIMIRIITNKDATELLEQLKEADVMHTSIDASGSEESVKVIFTVVKRKRWKEVSSLIKAFDKQAFYSIEDVRYANGVGNIRSGTTTVSRSAFDRLLRIRKSV